MRKCVIVGGAPLRDYDYIRSRTTDSDYVIYCDSGLKHREELRLSPDLIIGDFDSCENPHLAAETIVLPRAKDDTDTAYAVKEAVKRGFREVLMTGVTGGREDHTLVNLYLLFKLDTCGVRAEIVDDYSEMEVLSPGRTAYIEDRYLYFSLLNMTGTAEGITIRNAKFELENGKIESETQYATSNEVLPGKMAEVSIREGRVLVVRVRRE